MFDIIVNNIQNISEFVCDNYQKYNGETIKLKPMYSIVYIANIPKIVNISIFAELDNISANVINIYPDNSIKISNNRFNENDFRNYVKGLERYNKLNILI